VPGDPATYDCPHCGREHPVSESRCPVDGEDVPIVYRMRGRVLADKYEVRGIIGQGGMGIVYEGVHSTVGQRLAIKFIHPEAMTSKSVLARFENEAHAAASVGHRNIRGIQDMGVTTEGLPFIVMEYLVGQSLGSLLRRKKRIPLDTAMEITMQVLGALSAVHENGIVHRDLKPDNIFLVEEHSGFHVKILDFGLSRLGRGHDAKSIDLTRTGTMIGTPEYMSPEQARNSKDVDPRSDLFSVGVILYTMLTGQRPFEGDNHNEYIISLTSSSPTPPSVHNPDIPPPLEGVVIRALARDRDARWQTALDFGQALSAFHPATSRPVIDMPDIPTPPPSEAPSMKPLAPPPVAGRRGGELTWLLPVGIVALLILSGAIVFFLFTTTTMERRLATMDGSSVPEVKRSELASEPGAGRYHRLTIRGAPEDAQVFVDEILHPERPVFVPADEVTHVVRVEAAGHETWEKQVAIPTDVVLDVGMIDTPDSPDATAP